jgi:molybdopterin-containing oxidoreductase family membrane subunit
VDVAVYVGTLGTFFMLYLLFVRFLPMIPISEVKGVSPEADPHRPVDESKGGKP